MSRKKKSALGMNPLDVLIPAPEAEGSAVMEERPGEPRSSRKQRFTVQLPEDLIEQVRSAAYWKRLTLAELTTAALREQIAKLQSDQGEIYPAIPEGSRLKTGRPLKASVAS